MKSQIKPALMIAVLMTGIASLLSSCSTAGQPAPQHAATDGAKLWIEFPLEGQILPQEIVTVIVVGSAAQNASDIRLDINGVQQPAVAASSMSADGSSQMIRLEQAWIPPEQGQYELKAASVSTGSTAAIRFCIVTCGSGSDDLTTVMEISTASVPLPGSSETADSGATVTATIEPTSTMTLTPSATHTTEPTRTNTAAPEPTITVPPPADTTGPAIQSFGTFWEGCTLYGTATISDPSGVAWAEFWVNHNEEGWAWILMSETGGEWTSQVGIDTGGFAGSLEYKVRTLDSSHNESWSGVSVKNYSYCGD